MIHKAKFVHHTGLFGTDYITRLAITILVCADQHLIVVQTKWTGSAILCNAQFMHAITNALISSYLCARSTCLFLHSWPHSNCLCPCHAEQSTDCELQANEAGLSQGVRHALAAAAMATSAELTAMSSTLQVLSSHLDALQSGQTLPTKQGIAARC